MGKKNGVANGPPKGTMKGRGGGAGSKSSAKGTGKDSLLGSFSIKDYQYPIVVVLIGIVAGYLHYVHVERMFENQRFFSHLSTLERELSFRTEMGLYYSYYKEIVDAPSFFNGLYRITHCNLTEYPDTVNVLRRFNLYPEVVLGALYRFIDAMKMLSKDCYTINRGNGLSSVESCVGMGDIAHFYVYPIFYLNGLMMTLFFIVGAYLSGNILGGMIAVVSYFYNHGEATRVMWTPPLRESFSFPFLILQMLSVIHIIKCPQPNWKHAVGLSIITTLFMLPWQFAQFALLTQVCALFGMYILRFIDARRIRILLYGLLAAHAMNFVLQFANTLLISSFFLSAMIAALILVKLESRITAIPNVVAVWLMQGLSFLFLSFVIKVGLAKVFQIKDDAHIFDILKSKFTSFQDFHTLLYVCAPEFDFIGYETGEKLTKTLVLPAAALAMFVLVVITLKNEWVYWFRGGKDVERGECPVKPHAEIFSWMGSKMVHYCLLFLLLGGMSIEGYKNMNQQFGISGEYTNAELEQLVEWINANTPPDAVFAGAMPTMAALKLSCRRPVVNHPHYEDAGLRARTKTVYQLYSRKPPVQVHSDIKKMGVTHVVLEHSWCNRSTRKGCALPEVYDVEDVANRGRPPCCQILAERPSPFSRLYQNSIYTILKV